MGGVEASDETVRDSSQSALGGAAGSLLPRPLRTAMSWPPFHISQPVDSTRRVVRSGAAVLLPALLPAFPVPGAAQSFSIDDILSPGSPMSRLSAKAADRIAWIEFERGVRNVYTAAPLDFKERHLTRA